MNVIHVYFLFIFVKEVAQQILVNLMKEPSDSASSNKFVLKLGKPLRSFF
jgi:hypothetical protein